MNKCRIQSIALTMLIAGSSFLPVSASSERFVLDGGSGSLVHYEVPMSASEDMVADIGITECGELYCHRGMFDFGSKGSLFSSFESDGVSISLDELLQKIIEDDDFVPSHYSSVENFSKSELLALMPSNDRWSEFLKSHSDEIRVEGVLRVNGGLKTILVTILSDLSVSHIELPLVR